MKNLITIVGIIFILLGLAGFIYKGYTYTTEEKVAQLGPLQLTQQRDKTVEFSPVAAGSAIVVGLALIVFARLRRS